MIDLNKLVQSYLKARKNIQVSLSELQSLFPGDTDYISLANLILDYEEKEILKPVKSHKTNKKNPPLYNSYRINKSYFKDQLVDHIQAKTLKIHKNINLQAYFSLDEKTWRRDLPFIVMIDKYIKEKGLPENEASAPERSYEIVGDEKWIDFKGGRTLLQRIDIWSKLRITYNADPLMIAINPKMINQIEQRHLIVENKATFYDCLGNLKDTTFSSLVYGAGWKIVSNINLLYKQLGLEDGKNRIYYFGDLDYEGISIWYNLNDKGYLYLAVPFYQALLTKEETSGKENQRRNPEALQKFIRCFPKEEGQKIGTLVETGYYYPQEGLSKDEIREAWRKI